MKRLSKVVLVSLVLLVGGLLAIVAYAENIGI